MGAKVTLSVLLLIIFIIGCAKQTTTSSEQNQEQITTTKPKLSTLELSELVLQPSDFSLNFSIKERMERIKSDVSQEALDLGWKEGYYVQYARFGDDILDITYVQQAISKYPIENIRKVIELPYNSTDKERYDQLSNPNIGDYSRGFRITTKDEFGTETRYHLIEFVKMDIYESLHMIGTTTDYELLKELAKKAAAKVK